MTSPIAGKTIALTGTFTQLKRAEAEAKLTALGATIAKSLNAKTDLLICGDKAGSKIAKAQSLKVQVQDEAWLMDILAGGDGEVERAPLEGPLHDYMARLDAWVSAMRARPGIIAGYYAAPGASADRIDKLAKKWGLDSFSPAIRNLYLQADGFCVFWIDGNMPNLKESWDPHRRHFYLNMIAIGEQPSRLRAPQPSEVESFPWEFGGIAWVLPIADALKQERGYYSFAYNVISDHETRGAYGREWRGESLERAIRVCEAGLQYYPVGFVMDPPQADPPVILGDDHGACWTDSRELRFESYLEGLLNHHFRLDARRQMIFRNSAPTPLSEPLDLEPLLHKPPTLPRVEGDTFALTVQAIEPLDQAQTRAMLLQQHHWFKFANLIRLLKLKVTTKPLDEAALAIAEATQDLSPLDTSTVGKLCTRLNTKTKSKKALAEALWVNDTTPSARLTVSVTTTFDVRPLRNANDHDPRGSLVDQLATSVYKVICEQLEPHATVRLILTAPLQCEGTKHLTYTIDLLVEADPKLTVGQRFTSALPPIDP